MTYEDVHRASVGFAAYLVKNEAEKGDKMMIMLPNCIEWPIIVLGAAKVGVIYIPINEQMSNLLIKKHFTKYQPKFIVATEHLDGFSASSSHVIRINGKSLKKKLVDIYTKCILQMNS